MYIISRKISGREEILKDTNNNSNKTFSDFSSAEIFVKRLNLHIHKDKQWYVKKMYKIES